MFPTDVGAAHGGPDARSPSAAAAATLGQHAVDARGQPSTDAAVHGQRPTDITSNGDAAFDDDTRPAKRARDDSAGTPPGGGATAAPPKETAVDATVQTLRALLAAEENLCYWRETLAIRKQDYDAAVRGKKRDFDKLKSECEDEDADHGMYKAARNFLKDVVCGDAESGGDGLGGGYATAWHRVREWSKNKINVVSMLQHQVQWMHFVAAKKRVMENAKETVAEKERAVEDAARAHARAAVANMERSLGVALTDSGRKTLAKMERGMVGALLERS